MKQKLLLNQCPSLIWLLVLPLLFFLLSCKKNNLQQTSVNGTVVDATTQQPVPFARVGLIRQSRKLFSSGYSLADSATAGPDGRYSISFEAHDDYVYSVFAEADHYIQQLDLVGVTSGKKNQKNLQLKPEAFLKVHILRTTPSNLHRYFALLTPYNGVQQSFSVNIVDTVFVHQVLGNANNLVQWSVQDQNANTSNFSKSIYCTAHDTTTFKIEY